MNPAILAILYGLGGAIGWGASNFFAAKSTNEKSAVYTVFNSHVFLFLIMSVVILIFKPEILLTSKYIFIAGINYLFFSIGLLLSFKAYAIGPVSLTSPIVGANSIIVVLASVLFFNETLVNLQYLALLILFVGLGIVTYERKGSDAYFHLSGVFFAFVSLIFIGGGISGFVYLIGKIGWMYTLLLGYFFPAFWTGIYLVYTKQFSKPQFTSNIILLTVFQIIGTISVSVGIERALASIIIPVSSTSPLITSGMGLFLLKEKLTNVKYIGIAIIITSLVLLSL